MGLEERPASPSQDREQRALDPLAGVPVEAWSADLSLCRRIDGDRRQAPSSSRSRALAASQGVV